MNTAIDTNIIVALWDNDNALNTLAQRALDTALAHGQLIVAAPAYAELCACQAGTSPF